MTPRVEQLFVAASAGAPMRPVPHALALEGKGFQGDRYADQVGHWRGAGEAQVTLIQAEDLDEIRDTKGIAVHSGEHRRNLVVRGVALRTLFGRTIRVGEARLSWDRPHAPCGYLESLTEKGMAHALLGRGGICVRVVKGGLIRVGDPVIVEG